MLLSETLSNRFGRLDFIPHEPSLTCLTGGIAFNLHSDATMPVDLSMHSAPRPRGHRWLSHVLFMEPS